jgi:molecular chaperone GrpE
MGKTINNNIEDKTVDDMPEILDMPELPNQQSETAQLDDEADNLSQEEEEPATDWQEKYEQLNNAYLRLNADFDNYRKRTVKEKAELIRSAGENVLTDLLPVIDDFERALENIAKATDIDAVKEGVELIYSKFVAFLNRNGVKEIETKDEKFDIDRHEAVTTIPAASPEIKDCIVDCIQKGYTLGDKIIRYPKVVVAK